MTENTQQAARPQLIRAMNEQLLLSQIRQLGVCSRADLARLSGLSKPTVSLALANVERSGLVRTAGQRTGVPGRSAVLYEIRPEAGYVLGLDIGHEYLRGAIADLTGEVRAKAEARSPSGSVSKRVDELIKLADGICAASGIGRADVTQTVLGSPGVYDPSRDAIALTGGLAGWDKRAVLARLREAFGPNFVVENDTDAAALAEREHGHGREFASFAFVSIGSGIGMGLVLGGQLHRGAHGVAGEIAFLPISEGLSVVGGPGGPGADEVRRRGTLEAAGSSSAIVRSARQAGLRATSARQVFAAAAGGRRPGRCDRRDRGEAGRQGHLRDRDGDRPRARRARGRYRPGTGVRRRGDRRASRDRARAARSQGQRARHERGGGRLPSRRRRPGLGPPDRADGHGYARSTATVARTRTGTGLGFDRLVVRWALVGVGGDVLQ